MDISQFNYRASAEAGYTFTLKHPETGEDTDITITVIGADSKAYRNAFVNELRKNADKESVDTIATDASVYSKCISAWTNIEENGEALECTQENAFKLLENYPWITLQVAEAVESRVNFTTAQAKP